MKTKAKQQKHRAKKPSSSQVRIKWVAGGWGWVGWVGGVGGVVGLAWAWVGLALSLTTVHLR